MKTTIIFVSALFILSGCNTKQTPTGKTITQEQHRETSKLNEFLEYYDASSVKYSFSADKPIQIEGTSGIVIDVDPADLVKVSGKRMGKMIELEVKVLTDQEHLLKANAQTVSDGRILVSGGAYYIGLKSNGEELKLKDDRTLSVAFPEVSNDAMKLFYGEKGQLGELNWKETGQAFISEETIENVQAPPQQQVSTAENSERYDDNHNPYKNKKNPIYKAIQLNKLGWINCDRFYEIQNKTDLLFTFNPADSITSARVFLVFKGINSVMEEYYWHKENEHSFKNVPQGAKVSLIAVSLRKNKIYSGLTIEPPKPIEIALQETSIEQLGNLFHVE